MLNDPKIQEHCRDVIQSCLNVVDKQGDTYVAIHKESDAECVVLVSLQRTRPLLGIIIADKIMISSENAPHLFRAANSLNSGSIAGWHCLQTTEQDQIYMYRQSVLMSMLLDADTLLELIQDSIGEYLRGRAYLISQGGGPNPCA